MPQHYDGLGLRFLYPDNWKVDDETESSVTVESPGGAFMSVSRFPLGVTAEELLAEATAAMADEYEISETEMGKVEITGRELPTQSLRFTYLDFEITTNLYVLTTDTWSFLIETQGEDREMDELATVFLAMKTSLCQSLAA